MTWAIFKIIKDGIKAVPAVKYALAIGTLIAIIALIPIFKLDFKIAFIGCIALIFLMTLLLVFAKMTQSSKESFKLPARILMWFCLILFISTCLLLFSSIFFKKPVDLQFILIGNNIKQEEKKLENAFSENYMRLFGSMEATLMLTLLESNNELIPPKNEDCYTIKNKPNICIASNVVKFWEDEWEYKDAIPLKTPLWDKYAGNPDAGLALYWSSLATPMDALTYLNDNSYRGITGASDDFFYEKYNIDPSKINNIGISSKDIGYLCIILTNTTKEELFDIEFYYGFYTNPLKITSEDLENFDSKQNPKIVALKEDDLNKENTKKISIASLKPKKSVVWLLSAYKKNEDGLAEYYLTDVSVPKLVKFRYDSKEYSDSIRPPYGKNAARLDVPAGWYAQ